MWHLVRGKDWKCLAISAVNETLLIVFGYTIAQQTFTDVVSYIKWVTSGTVTMVTAKCVLTCNTTASIVVSTFVDVCNYIEPKKRVTRIGRHSVILGFHTTVYIFYRFTFACQHRNLMCSRRGGGVGAVVPTTCRLIELCVNCNRISWTYLVFYKCISSSLLI